MSKHFRSFRHVCESHCIKITGKIQNPENGKTHESDCFLWDTGATISAVNKHIVEKLGLVSFRRDEVHTASGKFLCPIYHVDISLIPSSSLFPFPKISVVGSDLEKETDVIIGMDVISKGSFAFFKDHDKFILEFFIPSMHKAYNPNK